MNKTLAQQKKEYIKIKKIAKSAENQAKKFIEKNIKESQKLSIKYSL